MSKTKQLPEQLKNYEGKWVALVEREGHSEVVAAGNDAYQAKEQAAQKGYGDVVLLKVGRFDAAYVPAG